MHTAAVKIAALAQSKQLEQSANSNHWFVTSKFADRAATKSTLNTPQQGKNPIAAKQSSSNAQTRLKHLKTAVKNKYYLQRPLRKSRSLLFFKFFFLNYQKTSRITIR